MVQNHSDQSKWEIDSVNFSIHLMNPSLLILFRRVLDDWFGTSKSMFNIKILQLRTRIDLKHHSIYAMQVAVLRVAYGHLLCVFFPFTFILDRYQNEKRERENRNVESNNSFLCRPQCQQKLIIIRSIVFMCIFDYGGVSCVFSLWEHVINQMLKMQLKENR